MILIKSLSILIVFSVLNLLPPQTVNAQGTYSCTWRATGHICQIDSKSINCNKDYSAVQSECEKFPTQPTCNSAKNKACVPQTILATCPAGYYILSKQKVYQKILGDTANFICCSPDFIDSLKNNEINSVSEWYSRCQSDPTATSFPICPDSRYEWVPGSPFCKLQGPRLHICEKLPDKQIDACFDCVGRPGEKDTKNKMYTALGCIDITPVGFISWLLSSAIGLGGGIAFLLMIFGAFQVIISGGDPEKLNSGKEIITSAVAGLLMIIFSVVLLRTIGVDILAIPGLTQ